MKQMLYCYLDLSAAGVKRYDRDDVRAVRVHLQVAGCVAGVIEA